MQESNLPCREVTALCTTAKSTSVHAGNRRSQYVSALPLSYTHDIRVRGRSRTCDLSLTGEVTAIYTTARPMPGMSDKGCAPLRACTVVESEVTLVCRHGQKWCPEKCSHLRLFLFREALALSQLSRRDWYARPELNWHAEAQSSRDCVSAYSTTGVWCQAPDSHRDAVRFELTRYANSRQLGGTRG